MTRETPNPEIYPGGPEHQKTDKIPENRVYQVKINGIEIIASRIFTREEIAEKHLKSLQERKAKELDDYAVNLQVQKIMDDVFGPEGNPVSLEEQIEQARRELEKIREETRQNQNNEYVLIPDKPVWEIYFPDIEFGKNPEVDNQVMGFSDPKMLDYAFAKAMALAHSGMDVYTIYKTLKKELGQSRDNLV